MRRIECQNSHDVREMATVNDAGAPSENYEEMFASFSEGPERWLKRVSVFLALLLTVVQLALLVPAIREKLVRTERLEGVPFNSGHDTREG